MLGTFPLNILDFRYFPIKYLDVKYLRFPKQLLTKGKWQGNFITM